MCTKNEKALATIINSLIEECVDCGMEFSEEFMGNLTELERIMNSEIDEAKVKGSGEKYSYTGVDYILKSQEERDKLGIIEFTVSQGDKCILRIYWSADLQWIMQPDETGETFTAAAYRVFPKYPGARGFLKQLAEEELKNPGAFARKYYRCAPKPVKRSA